MSNQSHQQTVSNRERERDPKKATCLDCKELSSLSPSVCLHICMEIADTKAVATCLQSVFVCNEVEAESQPGHD